MSPTKTLSAIRQLAGLGLPGKVVAPELMALLDRVVGFNNGMMVYLDKAYGLADIYAPFDIPLSVVADYAENFHDRPEGDGVCGLTTSQAFTSGQRVVQSSRYIGQKAVRETVFWDRILRPVDAGWGIQVPLSTAGRPLANLILARPFSHRDFSSTERNRLELAHPWLCHALACKGSASVEPATWPSGQGGIVLTDLSGRLVYASHDGLSLLCRAVGVPLVGGQVRRALPGDGKDLLKKLVRLMGATMLGEVEMPAAVKIRNQNGTFSLRAYPLDPSSEDMPKRLSIHIERHVPHKLGLFRSTTFLALPNREREVCQLLLDDQQYAEIAARLNLRPSTVAGMVKEIYHRLDVHSRNELKQKLLAQ